MRLFLIIFIGLVFFSSIIADKNILKNLNAVELSDNINSKRPLLLFFPQRFVLYNKSLLLKSFNNI